MVATEVLYGFDEMKSIVSEKRAAKRFCLSDESAKVVSKMLLDRAEQGGDVLGLFHSVSETTDSLWYIGEVWGIDFPFEALVESEVCQVKKSCPDIWPLAWEPSISQRYGVKGELAM